MILAVALRLQPVTRRVSTARRAGRLSKSRRPPRPADRGDLHCGPFLVSTKTKNLLRNRKEATIVRLWGLSSGWLWPDGSRPRSWSDYARDPVHTGSKRWSDPREGWRGAL